jgi:hypothetical protein
VSRIAPGFTPRDSTSVHDTVINHTRRIIHPFSKKPEEKYFSVVCPSLNPVRKLDLPRRLDKSARAVEIAILGPVGFGPEDW